ncbi:hypothetical protein [Ferdinandcohnia sp. SAFN-114]|uniref:hypothetical protein n=1 Tax=Ferdinandcohnia sp. SAFN-114 TaxID=3387275 RepID=UPI003F7D07CF
MGQDLFNDKNRTITKSGQKSKLKGYLTTVTAGVICSALTLTELQVLTLTSNQTANE